MKDLESIVQFFEENSIMSCLVVILGLMIIATFIVTVVKKFLEALGIEINTKQSRQRKNEIKEINDKFDEGINEIKSQINDFKVLSDKRTVVSLRSTIYRMHGEFTEQGYVTQEGLKTFEECVKCYEDAGGNDIVHLKLYPEVMKLPVRNKIKTYSAQTLKALESLTDDGK